MPFNFRFPCRPGLRKTSSPSSSHRINNIEVALVSDILQRVLRTQHLTLLLAPFQDRTEFSVGTAHAGEYFVQRTRRCRSEERIAREGGQSQNLETRERYLYASLDGLTDSCSQRSA